MLLAYQGVDVGPKEEMCEERFNLLAFRCGRILEGDMQVGGHFRQKKMPHVGHFNRLIRDIKMNPIFLGLLYISFIGDYIQFTEVHIKVNMLIVANRS